MREVSLTTLAIVEEVINLREERKGYRITAVEDNDAEHMHPWDAPPSFSASAFLF